jgi:MFS family permease
VSSPSRTAARRVALARMISYTGTSAAFIALVYAVFQDTGSSGWVAATLLVTLGVKGAVTPFAGTLGDRFDRRTVMIVSDLAGAAVLASMALVHSPWLLLPLALVSVVVETPFFPASAAAVPNLVNQEDLAWANGTIAFGQTMGYMLGPAIGGLMVAAGGASAAFLVDAVSFGVSAMLVGSVRGDFSGPRGEETGEHQGVGW